MKTLLKNDGIIVNSGNSYHYYGRVLLSQSDWQLFMFYSILLGPYTDVRYISHRLISGYCILRICLPIKKQDS